MDSLAVAVVGARRDALLQDSVVHIVAPVHKATHKVADAAVVDDPLSHSYSHDVLRQRMNL